jgi:cell shape-determining protein MreD
MESRRKRSRSQLLKWGCYVLALFVCAALQTTPGLFQLGQAKPLLVLPLCLAVAVFEGEFAGALLGTVGGLLWDYAAGRTVGMLALELLLLCFGVSVLVQLYLQVNPGNFAAVSTANGAGGTLAGLAVFLLYAGLYRCCAAVRRLCTAQCSADHPGGAAGLLAGAAHP